VNTDAAATFTIRRATRADAARLSEFAAAAFHEAFAAQNTAEDMASYVAGAFSPERQAAEISDPFADVLLVEPAAASATSALLGYAHLALTSAPACVTGLEPIELKRFYVASAAHGRGVARELMEATLEAARSRGARTLWLGVWERNARAIAFYGKHSFRRVGEQSFVLGTDVQTDWVMARSLALHGGAAGA
jgi:ribosomal protein S18 acetylase RimI-like enzyme